MTKTMPARPSLRPQITLNCTFCRHHCLQLAHPSPLTSQKKSDFFCLCWCVYVLLCVFPFLGLVCELAVRMGVYPGYWFERRAALFWFPFLAT